VVRRAELAGARIVRQVADGDAVRRPFRITPGGCRSGAGPLPAVGPVHVVAGRVLVAAEDVALRGRGFRRG
jgi:hypothetical protein